MITSILCLMVTCGMATAQNPVLELTVMTHDSFSISKDVLARFEQENAVKIRFLKAGDAGAALNQAILSKNNPLADVFYGVDNTFMSRALKADIFFAISISQSETDRGGTEAGYRISPVSGRFWGCVSELR